MSSLLRYCAYATIFLSSVSAFTVTFDTPTQCDPFTVSWSGGQAPFYILLTPSFSPFINITVPTSAFNNGQGTYTIPQLQISNGTKFLLTMSDGAGFGTGGTTTPLIVGNPVGSNGCNTKLKQDFYFQLPDALKQCAEYEFTGYDAAVQPVTITALIPGGIATPMTAPIGTSYNWTVNVQEGTEMLFILSDSQGRQGGASDLTPVAASTDGSCLVINSPSSTVSASSQPTSSQSSFTSSSKTPNVGVIAGATVGGVVFIALLIILGICCRRRAFRSSNLRSSLERQPSGLQRKDDDYDVKQSVYVEKEFSSPYKTDHVSHLVPPLQPGNQSHLTNVYTDNTLNQHLRQVSYADSHAGSSSITSGGGSAGGSQTTSTNMFQYQTLPTGLAAPIYPGTHIPLGGASHGNFSVNDPHVSSQMQSSHTSPSIDSFTRHGEARATSSSVSHVNRMAVAMAEQAASQHHTLPYQTYTVSNSSPPIQPAIVSDLYSQSNAMQASRRLNSTIERFARDAEAGSSSVSATGGHVAAEGNQTDTAAPGQILVHTDVEDVAPRPKVKGTTELPPQYADRQLSASQSTSGLKQKSQF